MEWIGPPDYLCEREPIDSFGIGQSHRIAGHGQRDRTEFRRRCFEPVAVHDQSTSGAFAIEPESELRCSRRRGVHSDGERVRVCEWICRAMEWIGPPDYLCEREPIDSFGSGQFDRIAESTANVTVQNSGGTTSIPLTFRDQSTTGRLRYREPESELRSSGNSGVPL